MSEMKDDPVNHPSHYTSDPSGIECITIVRHRNFNVGNAIKYLWRAGLKKGTSDPLSKQIEDLEKARWYITDEIVRLKTIAQSDETTEGAVEELYKRAQEAAARLQMQEDNTEAFVDEIKRNYVEYTDEVAKTRLYRVEISPNIYRNGVDFNGMTGELVTGDLALHNAWARNGCSMVLRFPALGLVSGFRPNELIFVGYKEE